MSTEARLDAIGIVVSDMAKSLAFYRRLGLDAPASADGEGHVEVGLAGGLRLLFDTAELVAAGYHSELAPFDAFWGQRYAVVHDPDGNGVDLSAPSAS